MTLHVVPRGDAVGHDIDDDGDCACGPRTEPVLRAGAVVGFVLVHHSLDGRERQE